MNPVTPLSLLTLGFILGLKHATDADHIVAVTAIVSKQKTLRHAALVGISWGIGHTFMIIIVGVAIILFHVSIPERMQLSFEFIVAIMLIVLGILNVSGVMPTILTRFTGSHHTHDHHGVHHTHTHEFPSLFGHHQALSEFIREHGLFHLIRPLFVGLIHGLAGSAAVALLVLGSIADEKTAIVYLGIFGLGTIVGMMILTTLIGLPIIAGGKAYSRFDRVITTLSGVLSMGYGLYFGYQIGIVQKLFITQ